NEVAELMATDYSEALMDEMGKLQEDLDHTNAPGPAARAGGGPLRGTAPGWLNSVHHLRRCVGIGVSGHSLRCAAGGGWQQEEGVRPVVRIGQDGSCRHDGRP
ncbi:hypothetical protein ABT147_32920, partial [Streptomyces sp. NPDC001868]|uniref:hypothetical protein n=1 Tax=Streptomyces sp. NPDC001868 TaxID=3154401 RepID=UPI00332231AB